MNSVVYLRNLSYFLKFINILSLSLLYRYRSMVIVNTNTDFIVILLISFVLLQQS